jgi:hypothetical protein
LPSRALAFFGFAFGSLHAELDVLFAGAILSWLRTMKTAIT